MQSLDRNKKLNGIKLCRKVQWLINLAGTVEMIDAIIHYFCKTPQSIILNINKSSNGQSYKSAMVYTSSNNISGHWVYYDSLGNLYNSYDLDHQKPGSNQFCQTYSLLYMLGDNSDVFKKGFTDKLIPGSGNYINNIKIVVNFWHFMFKYSEPLFDWMLAEVKSINNNVLANNEKSYISRDSSKIDKKRIIRLLISINNHAEEIAQNC
jgi:hypothetical protein